MMTRSDKAIEIKAISERIGKSEAAFLVNFNGMNVDEITVFRKQLVAANAEMKVVRNTLAKLALVEHPEKENAFEGAFVGPNAFVFAYEDPSAIAKIVTNYSKEVSMVVKNGILGNDALDKNQVAQLASLPSKDELRAMLLGTFAAPMSTFVRLLNEVPTGFVRVLGAKTEKA